MKRFTTAPPTGAVAAPEPVRRGGVDILPGDTADSLRAGYRTLMATLVTAWIGFVVIAAFGYIMAESLMALGVTYGVGKPVLLWLPIAIVAATGPVWLPTVAWIERRDLRKRVALVAERDRAMMLASLAARAG